MDTTSQAPVFSCHVCFLAVAWDCAALAGLVSSFAEGETEAGEGSLADESWQSECALCRQGCCHPAVQNKETGTLCWLERCIKASGPVASTQATKAQ